MTATIGILIADDHAVVREGLQGVIGREPGMEVVGEAKDGVEVVLKNRSLQPDVILLDLVMPRQDGIEVIRVIKRESPEARILVLTSFAEDEKVFPAIKAGAAGYLLKDSSPKELLQAIRYVYQGSSWLHPAIACRVMREVERGPDLRPAEDGLTQREVEVLSLVARGLSNQEIADRLVISELTVRTHVSRILDKLQLANRTQAALYALRKGIARLDSD